VSVQLASVILLLDALLRIYRVMKQIPECEINLITLTTLFFAFCVFVAFEIPGVVFDFYESSNFVDKPLYSNL
jgi:uncharacterized protein with PQ loop repeat